MGLITDLAQKINDKAQEYRIGDLQLMRKQLKGMKQHPGTAIFSKQTVFDDEKNRYAFHHGGRAELQFNIGVEDGPPQIVRHGLAFSLETSQTLKDINELRPQIRLFNEFISLYSEKLGRFRMWHWEKDGRSPYYAPCPIPDERIKNKVFIVFGSCQPIEAVDVDVILRDFDELLPLYRYVIGNGSVEPLEVIDDVETEFTPGCNIKALQTVAYLKSNQIDVDLRHNLIQLTLYKKLCEQFGKELVRAEWPTGNGTRIDMAIKHASNYWFYEVKTFHSPRACIREALGQLLEYSFWPKGRKAERLVVVGESPLDKEGNDYLEFLQSTFNLPIFYEQIVADENSLIGQEQYTSLLKEQSQSQPWM